MIKKSLKDLEADGWQVSTTDKEKVADHKSKLDLNATANAIAASIGRLAKASESMQLSGTQSSGRIEALMTAQVGLMELVVARIENRGSWDCDVVRNKGGFIAKINIRPAQ